jgi:hypothetical protein
MTALRLCPLAAVSLMLAACGGSSSQAQPLQSVKAPSQPLFTTASLTGTIDGTAVTLEFSVTPNEGTTTFLNQTDVYTSLLSITVLENGSTLYSTAVTSYYLVDPYYTLLGETVPDGSGTLDLAQITSTVDLPATLTVGDTGQLFSATFLDPTTDAQIGTDTESYSVTANDSESVELTISDTSTLNGISSAYTEIFTVNGEDITLVEVDVLVNGQMVQFTAS